MALAVHLLHSLPRETVSWYWALISTPACLAEPSHLCEVHKVETFNSSPNTGKTPIQTSTEMQEHRGVVTAYQAIHLLLLLLYKTKVLCKVSCSVALGFSSLYQHLVKTNTKEKGDNRRMTVILFLWAQAPSCSVTLYGSMCYRQRDEKNLKSCIWKEHSCNGATPRPSPWQTSNSWRKKPSWHWAWGQAPVPGHLKDPHFCSTQEFPEILSLY